MPQRKLASAPLKDLKQSALTFLSGLNDHERDALRAFLEHPTAIYEVKSHLPLEFLLIVREILLNAGGN